MKSKIVKYVGAGFGAFIVGVVLMLGATKVVYPAISQLVGLSVAQSTTLLNNVRDGAAGDNVPNGVLMSAIAGYDGTDFDRMRGTITYGLLTDVSRINGDVSVIGTNADNSTNTTTKIAAIPCRANAAAPTWTEGNQVPCSVDLAGGLRTSGSGASSPVQGTTLLNTRQASAANTLNTITLTGAANQRVHIYDIGRADCTAGTSSLQVVDGATLIYDTNAATVPTAPATFTKSWPTGLTGTTGNSMIVYVFACGVGNTSTVVVQADRF